MGESAAKTAGLATSMVAQRDRESNKEMCEMGKLGFPRTSAPWSSAAPRIRRSDYTRITTGHHRWWPEW